MTAKSPLFDPREAALDMHPITRPHHLDAMLDALADVDLDGCAHCGGGPALGYRMALSEMWIMCEDCAASGPPQRLPVCLTEDDLQSAARKAAAGWNRQPSPPSAKASMGE